MRMNRLYALAATFLLAFSGSLALAQKGKTPPKGPHGPQGPGMMRPGMMGGMGSMMSQMKKDLNLTDAQVKKLNEIRDANQKACKPDLEKMQKLHKNLSSLLSKPGTTNESQAMALTQQISNLRLKMMQRCVKTAIKAKAVLTTSQQKKLSQNAQKPMMGNGLCGMMGMGPDFCPMGMQGGRGGGMPPMMPGR